MLFPLEIPLPQLFRVGRPPSTREWCWDRGTNSRVAAASAFATKAQLPADVRSLLLRRCVWSYRHCRGARGVGSSYRATVGMVADAGRGPQRRQQLTRPKASQFLCSRPRRALPSPAAGSAAHEMHMSRRAEARGRGVCASGIREHAGSEAAVFAATVLSPPRFRQWPFGAGPAVSEPRAESHEMCRRPLAAPSRVIGRVAAVQVPTHPEADAAGGE